MRGKVLIIWFLVLIVFIVALFAGLVSQSGQADDEIGGLYAGTSNPGAVYKYAGGTEWDPISPIPTSESINIESPHPYSNDYNNTWIITRSGAVVMRIHFSYIRTESGYDYVYIKDGNGNIINTYSGDYTDIWTDWVFDDTLQIQLVSDGSVVDDGFVADQLEWSTEQPQAPLGWAVLSLVEYDGHLYAGTMTTNWVGQVYRYDGNNTWTLIGDNLDNQVSSLAVYKGDLYAGTAWNGMNLYKYTPGTTNCDIPNWTRVVNYTDWSGTRTLYIYHDYLLMGDIGWDRIGRWDGSTFYTDQTLQTGSCIYDFEDYGDYVYAAAYEGRMWQSSDGTNWSPLLSYYDGHMWELETFQNLLFMGYDNGELRASNVPDRGTLIYTAEDGIISMETDGNYLYFGTGGEAGYNGETTGISEIYRYDGRDVELISNEEIVGTGIQCLYYTPRPLLKKYAPVLYFDSEEKFYPWGIYSILDHSDLKNLGQNLLSNPRLKDLEEDLHGEEHYLDMRNVIPYINVPDNPEEIWGKYPILIYGRQYEPPNDPDKIVLQYWFFYPYDDFTNDHEGDWEMMQIILNKATEEPEEVGYSHHWDGNRDLWNNIHTTIGGTHSKVFVTAGGHGCWITEEARGQDKNKARGNGKVLYPENITPSLIEAINEENKRPYTLVDISSSPWFSDWPI